MKLIIKTHATLRGMDLGWSQERQNSYVAESSAAICAELGAIAKPADWDEIIVERADGRGLARRCAKVAHKVCGIYASVRKA